MTHYNPMGWGCLDNPDCLTACGKRVAQVASWTGNPDNATCKKCRVGQSPTEEME